MMASSRSYVTFILDQLSEAEGITSRPMMGETILYVHGRVFGGICDDRLLVKPVPAAAALLPSAPMERPYEGGKEMLLVENVDDRAFLAKLVSAMYEELPPPKPKKKK